jgi:predicted permease
MNLRRITALFRKEKLDAEMAAELRAHVELRTQRNIAAGLSPDEARAAAVRGFGGAEQIKERCRDERRGGLVWLEQLSKDFRHAGRGLRQNPGFAIAAIVSLAIGIGANTAMFSIVNEVLLRPLPYPEPERLVTLSSENRRLGLAQQPSSLANIFDWQKESRVFEGLAFYDPVSMIVNSGEPRRATGLLASPNLAAVLRTQPFLGRMFTPEEAARRDAVAVLSHGAWQQHHGGRADILGRRIEIDGRSTEIVGVMPAGILGKDIEGWLPHTFRIAPGLNRGVGSWQTLGRLAPGVTLAQAQTEMSRIAATLAREHPANTELDVRVVPLAAHVVGRDVRNALLLLLAAVGAVLLIACSNVGNLLLARGLTRQREFALRLSLGATRGRLVAQLLVENIMLCLIAAVVGLLLAWFAVDAVRAFAPANIPRLDAVTLDLRILGFALALSLASACVFGLLPALQSTRRDPIAMLRGGARGATDAPRGRRLRSALVVVEFALAVVLLSSAGMLLRSFGQLLAVDPGYRIENVLIAGLRLAANRPESDAIPFSARVVEQVAALPGVTAAAISEEVLLGERGQQTLSAERASGEVDVVRLSMGSDAITPDYFRALGVPLRDGRFFTSADRADSPAVVIINETLARQLWPAERAVGRRLRLGGLDSRQPWATVTAVVGDQRRQQLERVPIPQVFWPMTQQPGRGMVLIIRTELEPAMLAASVQRAVHSVDPTVPVGATTTLRGQIDRSLAPRRFHTGLLTGFASVALVLAGVGIFGLMHYAVARRTHEIGVRTALGASAAQILKKILAEGLVLAGVGVAIGLVGAVALLRIFSSLLYAVSPTDPISLTAAAGALITIALAGCFLPALRASRIDPMVALRCE